jgi:2-C-methyl-D-erythritol 4-phosphate cytidylyltransferase
MLEWSLDAFGACEAVGAIVVAVPPGETERFHEAHLVRPGSGTRTTLEVLAGGATRAASVANALAAVETEFVAVHDAARPLLTPALVEALLTDLDGAPEAAAVVPAAPVTDTIKRSAKSKDALTTLYGANASLVVEGTEDRSRLWRAQTPQVFRTEALRGALAAAERPQEVTDEAMLVELAGGTVLLHPVAEPNLKVTTPLDLRVAELLLQARSNA